jgi:hypothetical protein
VPGNARLGAYVRADACNKRGTLLSAWPMTSGPHGKPLTDDSTLLLLLLLVRNILASRFPPAVYVGIFFLYKASSSWVLESDLLSYLLKYRVV